MIAVWVTGWEMECCREAFSVGDVVQWPAVPVDRSDWLEPLFQGTHVVVHYSYRAHDDDASAIRSVMGRVKRIDAVTSAVVRTPIDAIRDSVEIADGRATRHPVTRVQRRPPFEDTGAAEFVGYLVSLV